MLEDLLAEDELLTADEVLFVYLGFFVFLAVLLVWLILLLVSYCEHGEILLTFDCLKDLHSRLEQST